MTIAKITQSDIKPLDQVDKINEIITNNVYQNKVYAYKAAGYKIYEGSTSNLVATASSSDVYICYSRFSKAEDITSNAFYSDTACTSHIFHLTGYSPYYEAGNFQLSFLNKADGLFRAYCYTPYNQYRLVFEFERYATGDVTNSGLIDWEGNDIDTGAIFIAEYGVTSYADVLAAYNAGKNIIIKNNGSLFDGYGTLIEVWSAAFAFYTEIQGHSGYYDTLSQSSGWSRETVNLANTNLSNLSSTGKTVLDGQWVSLNQTVYSGSLSGSSSALPKTVNVPNDGHTYEVLFRGAIDTGSSSGAVVRLQFSTNKAGGVYLCSARTRANSTVEAQGSAISYLSYASGNISIARNTNFSGTAEIVAIAYRRVGTNT